MALARRPTSEAWKTRSRASAHVTRRIGARSSSGHLKSLPSNASSAVRSALVSGEATSTSGGGSSARTIGRSALACASPRGVRRVSTSPGSTKSGAYHRFEARYSFISVRPCRIRYRRFDGRDERRDDDDDDDDDARADGGRTRGGPRRTRAARHRADDAAYARIAAGVADVSPPPRARGAAPRHEREGQVPSRP